MTALDAGRRARDVGMAAAQSRPAAAQDRLVIDQAIDYLAGLGSEFSANDVRELLPVVAGPLIGSRFLTAARRGLIERIGDTQATHEEGHARRISVWRRAAEQATSQANRKQSASAPAGPAMQTALF